MRSRDGAGLTFAVPLDRSMQCTKKSLAACPTLGGLRRRGPSQPPAERLRSNSRVQGFDEFGRANGVDPGREAEGEDRALASWVILDADGCVVRVGNLLDDGEAQAGAAG